MHPVGPSVYRGRGYVAPADPWIIEAPFVYSVLQAMRAALVFSGFRRSWLVTMIRHRCRRERAELASGGWRIAPTRRKP